MENRTRKLQFLTQFGIVDKVAVVCYRHRALYVVHHKGLAVDALFIAGCGIADMPDRHASRSEFCKRISVKYLVDKPLIAVRVYNAVVVDGNACALLPAVLQSIECIICKRGNVFAF